MYIIHNNFLGIDIDHMYIDTTFCSKNSHHLPSRQDSVNIVIKEIRNWLELSESFTLYILMLIQLYGTQTLY